MNNGNIEDIFIGNNSNYTKKKSKKGIIIVFIILLIILIGLAGAYFYFSKQTITQKQLFIQSLSRTNMNQFIQNDIYNEIINRTANENTETETELTFSTTEDNSQEDSMLSLDLSNFAFNLKCKNDIENQKSFAEFGINYSGNELFKARALTTENAIAIASDEIVNKYVGVHYDKIQEVFGIEFDKQELEKIQNSEKIEISKEEKDLYVKKYGETLFESIPEEKFTTQENIVIEKSDGSSADVVSYTLKLSQEEFNNAIVNVLTTLKNDNDLLGKLVTGQKDTNTENENTIRDDAVVPSFTPDTTVNLHDATDSSIQQPVEENYNSSETVEFESNSDIDTINSFEVEDNINFNTVSENGIEVEDSTDFNTVFSGRVDGLETIEETNEYENLSNMLAQILLGRKIDTTIEDFQNELNTLITDIKNCKGNGITFTVYVDTEGNTEKISLILPNDDNIDMEFTVNDSDSTNNILQITYLFGQNEDSKKTDLNEEEVITYSASDNITIPQTTDKNENSKEAKIDGIKIKINKIAKEASTTLKIKFDIIEQAQINQNINIEIKTTGTKTASSIANDIVINFATAEEEYKILLDNKIKFGVSSEIEDLNDENCLFMETLSEEERLLTIQAILEQIKKVYQEKINGLTLIDTNNGTTFVQQDLQNVSSSVTKEEAKNALIQKVSNMMGEAQINNQEFTIHNLENLSIDGYEVSTTITENEAIIVVDIYTFKINTNFELSEV